MTFRAMLRGWQASNIWVSLPGYLQTYDAAKLTCQVQPSLKFNIRQPDGTFKLVTLPLLVDVPVIFPHGGGYHLTFPMAQGDEGLVVFANRCMDSWWQSGGIQSQAEFRMNDLSDGFFIPGPYSQPELPASPASTTNVELRSDDGNTKVSLGPAGITLITPGALKLQGSSVEVIGTTQATFTGGGPGFVYQAGGIDNYTQGVPVTPHAPPTPT